MSKDIENEERLMLSEEEYSLLMDEYSSKDNAKMIEQINYYFDDENLSLMHSHKVLRVRLINQNIYELTMKIKGTSTTGDTELNTYIKSLDDFKLEKGIDPIINEIILEIEKSTSNEIKLITSLETKRLEVKYDNHLLVIDKNKYLDVIDYDLEIEAPTKKIAKDIILEYASKYSLTYKKGYISKSRRAFNYLLNKN